MEIAIAFFVAMAGWVLAMVAVKRESKLGLGCGVLALVGGLFSTVMFLDRQDHARVDREVRTTVVTGVIVEEHQITLSSNNGNACKESIMLERSLYIFEAYCSIFVDEGFAHAPTLDDVVRITFIAPKQAGDKPEVLDVYNLTQEEARARSVPPLPAEAPPDD